jgi:DNA-binding MarR family transcriptional regulator
MVAFIDALEDKGLVARRPHADDRRKNVVELTHAGRVTLRRATEAGQEAERQFLAPLNESAAKRFREALRALVVPYSAPTTRPRR